MTTHPLTRVSVLYVPNGWTLDNVIDEINVMGRIELPPWWRRGVPTRRGSWQVLVCGGDPCRCPHADEKAAVLPAWRRFRRWGATKINRSLDLAAEALADQPPEHP